MTKAPKTTTAKTVGTLVSERIAALGITQAEVSRATGVPPNVLSTVVHDTRGLGPGYATALGKFLKMDPALFDRRAQARQNRAA